MSTEIELQVNVRGMCWSGGASVKLDDLQSRCFEPLKTCSEPIGALLSGDKIKGSYQEVMVIKTREDAAKILAESLADLIVKEMSKNDTHNGYEVNEDGRV